ncbi:MAG: glycosyltransferase family 1 protein [Acidobacteriota bacterium]
MLTIGLQHVGGDDWMGGTYYLHNLARALRTLPKSERPRTVVVLTSPGDRRYYEDIASIVDGLDGSDGALADLAAGSGGLGRSIRETLGRSERATYGVRRIKRALGRDVNHPLEQRLQRAGVSVLFPCIRSMGAGFTVPWLAWAWDFQHKYLPDYFSKTQLRATNQTFADLAADARLIVTSSADALEDFDRYYPGVRDKLRVLRFRTVPEEDWFAGDVEAVRARHHLPPKYLVLPNQFWVHKNHRVAFEAMRLLSRKRLDVVLACTGRTEDFRHPRHAAELIEFIEENDLRQRIRILGLLPRHEQIQVIRGASAVVQPSLFEGWSTVVEDARALGKRLFLSDIAVHREQDPPGAVYFDPADPSALAKAIADLWDELPAGPDRAWEEEARGRQRGLVADYARTFLEIARELLSVWERSGSKKTHGTPAPGTRQ